jgi:hypothetical protein
MNPTNNEDPVDARSDTNGIAARDSRVRSRWHTVLGLLFSYHALAVTLGTLLPHESRLYTGLNPFFRTYLLASGSEQTWNMFTSAPYYATYRAVLVAEDREGLNREYGPVLPGLRAYNPESYRDHKLFGTLATASYSDALHAYFGAARYELESRYGLSIRSLRLRFITERLNNVARVRKTGRISSRQITDSEPRHWCN